jgi:hypothetical protein
MTSQVKSALCLTKGEAEWPMLSFDRAAYMLWNAIAGRLHRAGWSDSQIKEWLQSRESRFALEGELGEAIHQLGETYAECWINAELA